MNISTAMLPGLSPVGGMKIVAQFDGGLLSSDGGVLVLREVEQRLRVADRLAACIADPRAPDQITHTLAGIIRFRLLMIAAGYEDGNDANSLRSDPVFKMAHDLAPSERELCSQSTISRLENLPDARSLLRTGRAMVDLYCESFKQVPQRITLDIEVQPQSLLRPLRGLSCCPRCGSRRPRRPIRRPQAGGVGRRRFPSARRRFARRWRPDALCDANIWNVSAPGTTGQASTPLQR